MKRCKIVLTAVLSGMLLLTGPVMSVEASKTAEARYVACLNCGGRVVDREVLVYESIGTYEYKCTQVEGCTYRLANRKLYMVRVCEGSCGELNRHLIRDDGEHELHTKHH